MDVGKSGHKKCVGIKIVSPRQGHFGQKCRHLAVGATCRRHAGNFLSQGDSNGGDGLCNGVRDGSRNSNTMTVTAMKGTPSTATAAMIGVTATAMEGATATWVGCALVSLLNSTANCQSILLHPSPNPYPTHSRSSSAVSLLCT